MSDIAIWGYDGMRAENLEEQKPQKHVMGVSRALYHSSPCISPKVEPFSGGIVLKGCGKDIYYYLIYLNIYVMYVLQ